ncbi:hypothetical protein J6590_072443 [Homalodisca vitripennis]|nr:hypothetical protein J6590_072443 [Homalodisca vitripennis]
MNMGNSTGLPTTVLNFYGNEMPGKYNINEQSESSSSDSDSNSDSDSDSGMDTGDIKILKSGKYKIYEPPSVPSYPETTANYQFHQDTTYLFPPHSKITFETVSKIEMDIDFNDMISLIFLLFDSNFALQEILSMVKNYQVNGVRNFVNDNRLSSWARYQNNNQTSNWRMELVEALAVIQNYRILEKLGYSRNEINEQFQPKSNETLHLNRAKKMLFKLCDCLIGEQAIQLINFVRTEKKFDNDITISYDIANMELHVLFWLTQSAITIDNGVNVNVVTKYLKRMNLSDIVERIEETVKKINEFLPNKYNLREEEDKNSYKIKNPKNVGLLVIVNMLDFENNVEEREEFKIDLFYYFSIAIMVTCQMNVEIFSDTQSNHMDGVIVGVDGYDVIVNKVSRNQNDGVIVYVRKCFSVTLEEVRMHVATSIKINLSIGNERLCLLVVYHSPSHDLDLQLFNQDLEVYCNNRPRDRMHWIVGDINCCIQQETQNPLPQQYLDVLYGSSFIGCIAVPTRVTSTKSKNKKLIHFVDYAAVGHLITDLDWSPVVETDDVNVSEGLHTVKGWFDQNKLTVNTQKTKCMAISLRSSSHPLGLQLRLRTCGRMNGCITCECVESVDEYKYLGVTFDKKMIVYHIEIGGTAKPVKKPQLTFFGSSLEAVLQQNSIATVGLERIAYLRKWSWLFCLVWQRATSPPGTTLLDMYCDSSKVNSQLTRQQLEVQIGENEPRRCHCTEVKRTNNTSHPHKLKWNTL